MKRSCKAIFSLILALLLCVSAVAPALADASITFGGFSSGFSFEPGSEYTETDLFENFKNVMPGDTLSENITFTNAATDCDYVMVYMRAVTHDEDKNPLSTNVAAKETVATMTDFLSQLSMQVYNGDKLIYDASPDELDGLKEDVLLGVFDTGETATLTVKLSVPTNLDNMYANRVGEVDWVFHVASYNHSQLTVRKVWSDGNANHAGDSVKVNLLRNGRVIRTQELSAENGWAYTFGRLSSSATWTVEEANVPAGYTASYSTVGSMTTITNTKQEIIPTPTPTPEPTPTPTPGPTPTPTPTPTPAPDPGDQLNLTVRKVWSSDEAKNRPDCVTVTLYNGEAVYDSVVLNAENNWTYTWDDPDAYGNWQVIETNIPKGYVPSYSVSGDVVTITNTRSLIQTGQLNWPVWVLGGAGLALVALGGVMLVKKKKQNDA